MEGAYGRVLVETAGAIRVAHTRPCTYTPTCAHTRPPLAPLIAPLIHESTHPQTRDKSYGFELRGHEAVRAYFPLWCTEVYLPKGSSRLGATPMTSGGLGLCITISPPPLSPPFILLVLRRATKAVRGEMGRVAIQPT